MDDRVQNSVAARLATKLATPLLAGALFGVSAAGLLTGCGQKGPLTLPATPAAASSASAAGR